MSQLNREDDVEVKPMGFITRLVSLFVAPQKLMENIAAHPRYLQPLIVLVFLLTIPAYLSLKLTPITLREQSNMLLERYGTDFLNLSSTIEMMKEVTVAAWVGGYVALLASVMIISFVYGLFVLIGSKIMGGGGKLSQFFSAYLHITIISYIGAIVAEVFSILMDTSLNFTSLAAVFMPNGNSTMVLYNLFSSITIFSIWESVLLYIVIKVMNQFSKTKAVILTIVFFVLGVALATGMLSATMFYYDMIYSAMPK